jgi:hypothetical protein
MFRAFFMPSEQQKKYLANFAEAQKQMTAGAPQSASAGAQSPSEGVAAAAPAKSQFKKADVDVAVLAASIQQVDFDYDAARTRVNPMTPLVGPMAPMRLAAAAGDQKGGLAPGQPDIQALVRNIKVTGILWEKRNPLAVVNDEVVSRGHVFQETGVTIQDIERDRVIVSINDVQVPIEMEER